MVADASASGTGEEGRTLCPDVRDDFSVALWVKPESDVMLNTETHRCYVKGKEIPLKNKEYELLLFLMTNADRDFSKEDLYERIWGLDAMGDNATVAVHINRLREKMEADPSHPEYIQTVWGAGYRFGI